VWSLESASDTIGLSAWIYYSLTQWGVNKIQRTGISTEPWFSNFKTTGFLTTTDAGPVRHENHRFFDVLEITGTNHFSDFDIFSFQKK
jgi:hypothetical protein